MPTIDQLAPATAASDTDLLMAEQSSVTRSVTRAQIVAGLQPEIVLPQGSLLGRSSSGTGSAETILVGANLTLNGGTLAATAAPFQVASTPAGVVPRVNDLVALSQNGTNVGVPYSEFLFPLAEVPGLNISGTTLTPAGSATPQLLSEWAAGVFPNSGGTLTGAISAPTITATESIVCTGNTNISGLIASQGLAVGGGATVGGSLSVAGPVLLEGTASCGSLTVSGNLAVVNSVSALNVTAEGNALIGGDAVCGGALVAQSGITITAGMALMPSYLLRAMPTASAGAMAYVTDGRKPSEPAGGGTGVLAWGTGAGQWLSVMNGLTVQS